MTRVWPQLSETLCTQVRPRLVAETPWGKVRVKRGLRNGVVLNVHPEFEDCRKVAEAANVPLKQVMAAALAALGPGR